METTTSTLTRDDVLTLPTGLELDKAVAEHVYNCRLIGWHGKYVVIGPYERDPIYPDRQPELPSYSTDIASAWDVVRYIRSRLFARRVAFERHLQAVISRRLDMKPGDAIAVSEIILRVEPEDICRAALLTTIPA